MRGWALAEQGQGEEGIVQMRQGLSCLPSHGGRAGTAVSSCPAGRGIWESRAGRGRADRAGRGAGFGGQNWGAFVRGGAVSAQGRCLRCKSKVVSRVQSLRVSVPRQEKPKLFSQGHEIARKQQAKSLELRAADEPGRLWQQQGKQNRSSPAVVGDLQLVHRRI